MDAENIKNKNRNILIIDDELEITKALVRQFKRSYTVFSATNTVEAFDILKKENIQVIISDQRMPGMTGVEFFTSIKTNYPHIIKLILTGYSDIEAVIAAINLGQVFRYITKPWNPDELDSIINEAFEKYELQAQNRELVTKLTEANILLEKKVTLRTHELEHQNIALKDSEERFEMLFNKAPLGYQSMDIVGNLIEVNQKWLDTLGYERNEVIGKWFGYFLTPICQDGFRKRFPIFKAQGQIHSEFEMIHKNGSILFIAFDGRIGNDDNGNFKQTHCILQDITEQRKSERKLAESEEKFRSFFDNSVVGKSITSIDGKLSVNKAFCGIVGYSEEELNNLHWKEITHPDDIEKNSEIINSILKGEKNAAQWEKRYIHKEGHIVWVDINTKIERDNNGNPLYFITALIDISHRKKAEASLRQSEEDFRNLIELSPMAMVVIHEWKTIYFNPSGVQLFGAKTLNELLNRHIFEFVHPEYKELVIENAKKLTENGYVKMQEQKFLKLDGSILDIETQAKSIRFNDTHATLVIVNDITERKNAEKALQKSEERYKNLLLHLETGIVVHAADTSIITCNPRASELLGLTNEQMIGKVAIDPEWKFVDIDNIPLTLDTYPVNRIVKSKKSISDQILGIHQSSAKNLVWVTVNGFPVMNENNEITEIVISFNDVTNKINAENLLENERALYLDLVNTQPAGIYRIRVFSKEKWEKDAWKNANTIPYKTELLSNRFCEILGINQQIFESNPGIIVDLVHPDDKEEFVRRNEEANTLVINFSWNCRLVINNKIKWVHFESLPRKLENGDILFTGIIYDISEQKKAEESLRSSQKLLSETEKIGKVGGWEYYYNSGKMNWTEETYNIHELQYDKNISLDAGINFYTPEAIPIINNAVQQAIEFSIPFDLELNIITVKGNIRTVHTIGKCDPENQRIYGFFQDITERKKAEKALQESEHKLSALFNGMSEITVIHELTFDDKNQPNNYRIIDCNQAFSKITGIEPENAVGKLATEVYGTETAPYLEEYSAVCQTNTNYNYQTYYQPMDKHFLISAVPLDGNRFATITADISDIEKVKEVILEKNKELENLIYVASHDLRSPLVNIQGFSQRLENHTSEIVKIGQQVHLEKDIQDVLDKLSTVEIPKSLGYIKSNITKMDSLINGLLKLSRTGRILMNISEINMNILFQSIINTHQFELSELDANVEMDLLINCYGDENQLNQLFSNIIANAIKYRDTNRQLKLKIHSTTHVNKVVYAITDNGIGINNKYLPKIWDIFYRVNPTKTETGEGLGLSVARKIAEKHKGKVWVESEVGVGSTFYVELLQNKFEE